MFWKKHDDKIESFVIGQCYKINGKKVGKFIGIDKKSIIVNEKDHAWAGYNKKDAIIFIFNDNGKINDRYARLYGRGDSVDNFNHSLMFFSKYRGDYYEEYTKYILRHDYDPQYEADWKAEIDTCSSGGRRSTISKKAFRRGRTTRKKSLRQRK